jgi:aspartyl-tRNA(Asn)/glutamyl-tRNA(Gln) amidotransferase subunit C
MAISKEEVIKVAKLARIDVTEEEVGQFQSELSAILEYVEQLQKVDTSGVEETAQVTGLENVFRKDEVVEQPEGQREATLAQAPERVANLIKVKSVFK